MAVRGGTKDGYGNGKRIDAVTSGDVTCCDAAFVVVSERAGWWLCRSGGQHRKVCWKMRDDGRCSKLTVDEGYGTSIK